MAFNVDAFRESHRPWSFTVGAVTFLGRHVSAMTVMRYEDMLKAARHPRQMTNAVRWLLRHAFPWRPSYLLRGDPVSILMGLEPQARREALDDFFGYLRGPRTADPSRKTPGTRSPAPTQTQSA